MSRPLRLRQLIQLEILQGVADRSPDGLGDGAPPLQVEGIRDATTAEVARELQEQGLLKVTVHANGTVGRSDRREESGPRVVPDAITEEGREYLRLLDRTHESAGGGTVADRTRETDSRGCPDDL